MGSTYGKRHGLIGYDSFKTGLDFRTVQSILRVESDDPRDWRQKSRGCVLGLWHKIKLELYQQACDIVARGLSVEQIIAQAQAATGPVDIAITRHPEVWSARYLTAEALTFQAQLPPEGCNLEAMAAGAIVAGLHITIEFAKEVNHAA